MAGEGADSKAFSFHLLSGKPFPSLEQKIGRERLQKWGLENRLIAQTYSFDQHFKIYQSKEFALNFFSDGEVVRSFMLSSSNGSISYGLGFEPDDVRVDTVPCTCISMSLFDKLKENDIIQENGYIRKCFEEYIEGVPLPDQLRNVLLNEDFEKYDIYSDEERAEFLFKLFSHVCVGGGVCQYEDRVDPYVEQTKFLYKDMISVQKESSEGGLHVVSYVLQVEALDKEGDVIFPDEKQHLNSFCYLIIDPIRRHVTVLHHKYGGGLW